jgi:esterase/lipase superfamily enzyme
MKFEQAVLDVAGFWHFLGRQGVPIAYTWPAGRGGALRGYTYDRESGQFTIFHLKQFLRLLASCPQLRKIHVVAHSRGTDVAASAIRELFIESRGAGGHPNLRLKIGNLVLLAPDIDVSLASQRFAAEGIGLGLDRLTIYVSQNDRALDASNWLHSGLRRVGQSTIDDLPVELRGRLENAIVADIVDVRVPSGLLGHTYAQSSPEASSDLILLLRDNRDPGRENGRPLERLAPRYWVINEGYPHNTPD